MNLDFIAKPMGSILNFIFFNVSFHSYGFAIIIFTLLIKSILLPLTVKQYRSTAKMQEIQPMLAEVQKRYKNDKEKYNQELMKLYKENNVNPAGGCLPLLIQMPILFSLYWVISQPLKLVLQIPVDLIAKLKEAFQIVTNINPEISIVNNFNAEVASKILDADTVEKISAIGRGLISLKIGSFPGFNLGLIPKWNIPEFINDPLAGQYLALLIIPVLAGISTFLSIKTSMQSQQTNQAPGGNEMAASMQKSMTTIMPFMTAFFAFSVPAGLGLYWIIGNIFQILQQQYMNKYIIKKKKEVIVTK